MRSLNSLSVQSPPLSSSKEHAPYWNLVRRNRLAAAVLGFFAVFLIPVALFPATDPGPKPEPRLACATIDWRVGEKLTVMSEHDDPRTRAIVNSIVHQREAARAQCRDGRIEEAMIIYRLLDRALTRYVQYGAGPALPKQKP